LVVTSSGDANIQISMLGSNNVIAGATLVSSDNSVSSTYLADWNTLTLVTFTTSWFSIFDADLSGNYNTVSGFTFTGSGTSNSTFSMPADTASDTGRTLISGGSTVIVTIILPPSP
jgi:hypothetical protein